MLAIVKRRRDAVLRRHAPYWPTEVMPVADRGESELVFRSHHEFVTHGLLKRHARMISADDHDAIQTAPAPLRHHITTRNIAAAAWRHVGTFGPGSGNQRSRAADARY